MAPASRAAASPRGPISGCMLWKWATSAPRSRTAPATPPSSEPPRTRAYGRRDPAGVGRAALEQRVRDPGRLHGGQLQLGRALLSADRAVAVVHDEHAWVGGLGHGAVKARCPCMPPNLPARWTRPPSPWWSRRATARPTWRWRSRPWPVRTGTWRTRSWWWTTAPPTRPPAWRPGRACAPCRRGGGLNAARNTGVDATTGSLVAFLDDDVWAPPGWLAALRRGDADHPDADVFGGPIRARLEGPAPRGCGREPAPITTLDLGAEDVEAEMVWGANFAVRRDAFERFGRFDASVGGHGDEEEWLLALRAGRREDRLPGGCGRGPPACRRRLAPALAGPRGVAPRAAPPAAPTSAGATPRPRRASCATWRARAGTRCAAPAPTG